MNISMWLDNLAAFSLQVAILVAAGSLLCRVFRLRLPSVLLVFWRVLLVACLLLPFVQPYKRPVVSPPAPAPVLFVDLPFESPAVNSIPERSSYSPRGVIALVLVAGVALRLLWLCLGFLRLSLYRHRARWISLLPPTVREMQDRIGVRPDVYISSEIDSPVTFGLYRPVVLLPSTFPELDEKFQKPIACHELLHVRRRDWAWMVLEEVVRSLFWFHPAFWWVLNRIHLSREQVVDGQVLKMTRERQPYLESLLRLAEMRGRPASVPAPLLLRERHLVARVALMLKEAHMPKSRLIFSLALIAGLLFGAGSYAANIFPLSGSPVIVQMAQPVPLPEPEGVLPAEENINIAAPHAESNAAKARKVEEIDTAAPEVEPQPQPEPAAAQERKQEPIRVGGNVQESKLLVRVDPEYPEEAKRARIAGTIIMQVTVSEDGSVEDVKVLRGHPLLNDAAVSAVKQWRYSPTLLNGEAVPVVATVTVIFNTRGNSTTVELDAQGNAREVGTGLEGPALWSKMKEGTVSIRAMADVPYRTLEWFLLSLQREGITIAPFQGGIPHVIRDGRVFLAPSAEVRAPQLAIDHERLSYLVATALMSGNLDVSADGRRSLRYNLFVDESGRVTSVQPIQGPKIAAVEEELLRTLVVAPGYRGAEPVPTIAIVEFTPK